MPLFVIFVVGQFEAEAFRHAILQLFKDGGHLFQCFAASFANQIIVMEVNEAVLFMHGVVAGREDIVRTTSRSPDMNSGAPGQAPFQEFHPCLGGRLQSRKTAIEGFIGLKRL
jgi:hypothetical protein